MIYHSHANMFSNMQLLATYYFTELLVCLTFYLNFTIFGKPDFVYMAKCNVFHNVYRGCWEFYIQQLGTQAVVAARVQWYTHT